MNPAQRIFIFAGLLSFTFLAGGCASAIYDTGKDKDVLCGGTTRAVMIQRFGEPIGHGTDAYERDFEVFQANGKIAPNEEDYEQMLGHERMTMGLAEFYLLPKVLIELPFKMTGKKDVLVYFNEDGKYYYHKVYPARSK